ncbi:protein CYTOKININ-RESPONSIVE GATA TRANSCRIPTION FACTOR 1-like [Phragmites australis]|uniref:protein CYTOKININ-RESPONSIVE GATA TRANSCRIPTION FACTOR 1-like n=1 Tax=Phragmites australis TaxID=29695 RepID=UPI002D775CE3|nr:protein CYTOKININ-RESPONSIVE GATA TRANSCRIPTION FACTOR 1-like [Phragmites australis]
MSAIYMSQLSTALPLMEGDHQQDHRHQGHFQAFTMPKDPPLLFPFVISNSSTSDGSLSYGSADHHLTRQHQAMLEPQHMINGSSASVFAMPFPTVESIHDDMIEPSSYDPYDMGKLQVSGSLETGSWTPPAKMRITRKVSADPGAGMAAKKPRRRAQAYEDMGSGMSSQPNLGVIRVCSDCNTTKTPLWRSGPCGPKSLCNACGIRQRKARRAMMASGASSTTDGAKATLLSDAAPTHPKVKKEKRADVDRSLPFKKRCKVVQDHAAVATPAIAADKAVFPQAAAQVADGGLSRDLVDNIGLISWSRSPAPAAAATVWSSFLPSPALPVQDEITDAAMLLMTLSCGLVRS